MNRTARAALVMTTILAAGIAIAQSEPPSPPPGGGPMMGMTDADIAADSFVGITVDGTVPEGTPRIDTSWVDLSALTDAAAAFVATLTEAQRGATMFDLQALEWRKWNNVDGYQRDGISLAEMTGEQSQAAWALLTAALSAQGLDDVRAVMHLNLVEGELLGQTDRFDEDLYWITVMGVPGQDEAWGFQLDGHHLVLNIAVNGTAVAMTPAFLGTEPAVAPEGTTYAGETALQAKQDAGLAFVRSLDADQLAQAVIEPDKTGDDLVAGAFADNAQLAYEGIRGDQLTEAQRGLLVEAIRSYTGDLTDDAAELWLSQVSDHLDETWFAWIGDTDPAAVFYYRIYSPVLLIEFDHQLPGPLGANADYATENPTREHIHTIVRTPNGGDYGDLLRQHLAEDH